MRYCLVIFIVWIQCHFASSLKAQFFGGNPASVKWNKIETDTASIIFPAKLDKQAKRVSAIIHQLQTEKQNKAGETIRKIDLVLQPHTTISNGYVSLAPYRSELFLTPLQNPFLLGAGNWTDLLAIHEWRHVQQFSNYRTGLSKWAFWLLGEQGQALANSAAIPDWFFEGDAVWSETFHTLQGRGRSVLFTNRFHALEKAQKEYSYMKLRNGSLKDYVPNHYELGYLLTLYGAEKWGSDFWSKVAKDAAAYKKPFYPFQQSFKQYTGLRFSTFKTEALQHYQSIWQQESIKDPTWITATEKRNVIDYQYPHVTNDSSIIALKKSYQSIPQFVAIKNGQEKVIATSPIAADDYFSYRNGKIIFGSFLPDRRWGYQDFTEIRLYSINEKSEKILSSKSKHFSPDISHSGQLWTAVKIDGYDTGSELILISIDGNEKKKYASDNIVFSHPQFTKNDAAIVVAGRSPDGKMGILQWHTETEKIDTLLPFQYTQIGFLKTQGDSLHFTAYHPKGERRYAIVSNQLFELNGYATGLFQSYIFNNQLYSSYFTASGMRLGVDSLEWQTIQSLPTLSAPLAKQSSFTSLHPFQAAERNDSISRYKKLSQPFNFHSWRPMYNEPEYSFSLYGNNTLNTTITELSYTFNRNENSHRAQFQGVYGSWYLQPSFAISQTWNRNLRVPLPDGSIRELQWNESEVGVGLRLPLQLTKGRHFQQLSSAIQMSRLQRNWLGNSRGVLTNDQIDYLDGQITYIIQSQKARQHIYPRFAQVWQARYRHTTSQLQASQLLLQSAFFLPGIGINHNLVLQAAYYRRDTTDVFFSNIMPFSRGHEALDFPRAFRWSANYHFPLFYPDWGFGNIVYIQRVRANVFYDFTRGKSLRTGRTFDFTSTGIECFFDSKWWNQLPATVGIRYSRLLQQGIGGGAGTNRWEIILPLSLLD